VSPSLQLFSDRAAVLTVDDAVLGDGVSAVAVTTAEVLATPSSAEKPPWRDPLDRLIAAGRAQDDPAPALAALLLAQSGMGDQLLTLLLESEGGQEEQDALMVALAMALSIGNELDDVFDDVFGDVLGGVQGGVLGEDLANGHAIGHVNGAGNDLTNEAIAGEWASLWFDRGGTILAMADLWISGDQRAKSFPRFMQMEGVLEPWHAIELASMMEFTAGQKPLEQTMTTRLLKMIEMSLASADPEALAIAGEWLQSTIPELRLLAQQTVVSSLVDDAGAAAAWIHQADESLQVPLLEAVLRRISADQLPRFLDQAADVMLNQEYHGSALLAGFSRATHLDLQQMVYQRGESLDSVAYRNLVLYGSQGGIGRGDRFPPNWVETLRWVAETDPSRSVRGTALRICALSWPISDRSGFQQLIQASDVDFRTAEMAASLLEVRGQEL
ncbi:MAG: hypothetical protein OSB09_11785, partial [Planctomycetota bacterium]|nr:hypothetical protein [Planctomycetota bacterium]